MAGRPYDVKWADAALGDLDAILEFAEAENPGAAAPLIGRIMGAASTVCHMPQRGRVVPEFAEFGLEAYREIVLAPWRIVYEIRGKRVYVMLVVDGRRDVQEVLVERLLRKR